MALRHLRLLRPVLGRLVPSTVRNPLVSTSGVPSLTLLSGPLVQPNYVRHYATKKSKVKAKAQSNKVNINAALVEDIISLDEVKEDMAAILTTLKDEFSRNLSIRTSPGALDHITVTTKDGKFPLNQLGQISMKSPQLLVVNMTGFPEGHGGSVPRTATSQLHPRGSSVDSGPRRFLHHALHPFHPIALLWSSINGRYCPGPSGSKGLETVYCTDLGGVGLATAAVIRAIQESSMGLNPEVEGTIIRVPIPKVTREHRENLTKLAKQFSNKAKDSLRRVRSNAVNLVKKSKEGVSEDTIRLIEKQVQQMADSYVADIDKQLATKTKELLG